MAPPADSSNSDVLEAPATCFTHGHRELELLLQTLRQKLQLANTAQHLLVDCSINSLSSSSPFPRCSAPPGAASETSTSPCPSVPRTPCTPILLQAQPASLQLPRVHLQTQHARAISLNQMLLQLHVCVDAAAMDPPAGVDHKDADGQAAVPSLERTDWECGHAVLLVLNADGGHCMSESQWEQQGGMVKIQAQMPVSVMGEGGGVDEQVAWAALWLQLHNDSPSQGGHCTMMIPLDSSSLSAHAATQRVEVSTSADGLVVDEVPNVGLQLPPLHALEAEQVEQNTNCGGSSRFGSGLESSAWSRPEFGAESEIIQEFLIRRVSGELGADLSNLAFRLRASGEFRRVSGSAGTRKFLWSPAHMTAATAAWIEVMACSPNVAEVVLHSLSQDASAAMQRGLERVLLSTSEGAEYVIRPNNTSARWLDEQQAKLSAMSALLESHLESCSTWLGEGHLLQGDGDVSMTEEQHSTALHADRTVCSIPLSKAQQQLRACCHLLDTLS